VYRELEYSMMMIVMMTVLCCDYDAGHDDDIRERRNFKNEPSKICLDFLIPDNFFT
jgi:hypothetical protein